MPFESTGPTGSPEPYENCGRLEKPIVLCQAENSDL
jgi:hypothetical protein